MLVCLILLLALNSVQCRSVNEECRRSSLGFDYTGRRNTTLKGKVCQSWSSQFPHKHTYTDARQFPDDTIADAANYCRNPTPSSKLQGPWCYTTDPLVPLDYCDIPACSEFPGCRLTDSGAEYKGDIHQTRSGLECLPWTLVDSAFKSDDSNYCRNPDNKPDGPWCYTGLDDLSWEHCNVPFCKPSAYCKRTAEGEEYVGTVSVTKNGLPCQPWASQVPHQHQFADKPASFPGGSVSDASNYCRNPDGQSAGPWCFTKDPSVRRENCDVPICADCKISTTGVEYAGVVSRTKSGRSCLRWNDLSDYAASLKDPNRFPDVSLADASNFCRNPDKKSTGPWCYWADQPSAWESCDIPTCSGKKEDTFKPRLANHVVHIGIDGINLCFLNSSSGTPNILNRIAAKGTYTLSRGRTDLQTWSAPSWTAVLCSMPAETSGITNNAWRPPWKGFDAVITPSTGRDIPFPCVWHQIKSQDAGIRTASFTNWDWFWYLTSLGLPEALDYDFYCPELGVCDGQLVSAAVDYLEKVLQSSESSYTFIYIGKVDETGHAKGWCLPEYLAAVDEADLLVGKLMDVVEKMEQSASIPITVMLGTDHGGHRRTHGQFLDSDLIIPAFVRGPHTALRHGEAGKQFRHDVSNIDFAPTALEWLGLKQSPWWRGRVMEESFKGADN